VEFKQESLSVEVYTGSFSVELKHGGLSVEVYTGKFYYGIQTEQFSMGFQRGKKTCANFSKACLTYPYSESSLFCMGFRTGR
jgi:hypothetical protein